MSSSESLLKLLFTRPGDFRTLLQFKLFHEYKRDLSAIHEHPSSGWDRRSMRRCWEFLDMTSRSFSAVIKELDGELARVVSYFFSFPLPPHGAPAHYRAWLIPYPNDQNTEMLTMVLVSTSLDLLILPRIEGVGHRGGRHDHPRRNQATSPPLLPHTHRHPRLEFQRVRSRRERSSTSR